MKLVIQRVTEASVSIEGTCVGKIGKGYMVLFGAGAGDTKEMADKLFDKMIKLRIFADENGKTNKSIQDVEGELLIVSQFTLYANCKKGNRPSFLEAGSPQEAEELYRVFGRAMREMPPKWRILVLSSHTEFERCFGRQADKKRKLYNGMLKCDVFQYGK